MITRNANGWPTNPLSEWTFDELTTELAGWDNPDEPHEPGTVGAMMIEKYRDEIKRRSGLKVPERFERMPHRIDWMRVDGPNPPPKDGTPILGLCWEPPWAESHAKGDIARCWYEPQFEDFITGCREMRLAPGYTFEDGKTVHLHSPEFFRYMSHWTDFNFPLESEDETNNP